MNKLLLVTLAICSTANIYAMNDRLNNRRPVHPDTARANALAIRAEQDGERIANLSRALHQENNDKKRMRREVFNSHDVLAATRARHSKFRSAAAEREAQLETAVQTAQQEAATARQETTNAQWLGNVKLFGGLTLGGSLTLFAVWLATHGKSEGTPALDLPSDLSLETKLDGFAGAMITWLSKLDTPERCEIIEQLKLFQLPAPEESE